MKRNNLRVNLTLDELELLISNLKIAQTPTDSVVKANLRKKFITKAFVENRLPFPSPWVAIVNIIAKRTGCPQAAVQPPIKLKDLGLVNFKIGEVHQDLNHFIEEQGSQNFITTLEMKGVVSKTVRDLYILVEHKINP
jgi:hypothetical protein